MYNPLLDTLIEVAECGSFLKASERLYISPTAVMKQINQLERHIGLPLFIRTRQGVALTRAGKSIYEDAVQIIKQSRRAIQRAYKEQEAGQIVIRVGTSALYPCRVLMDIWNKISEEYPQFKLKIIPFEDTGTDTAFANVGKKYDLMTGTFNSVQTAAFNSFLKLGEYRFCISVPGMHPLSGKKSVTYEDLHGEILMMQRAGNSPINDRIRSEIESGYPEITIYDLPYHYDLEVFNLCEEKGYLLLSLENWKEVHPSLVSVPLQVDYKIPYGIIYSADAGEEVKGFIESVKENL